MEEDFDLDPIEANKREIIKHLVKEARELYEPNELFGDEPPRAVFDGPTLAASCRVSRARVSCS